MTRSRLRDLLVRHSYRYDPGGFQLASGRRSEFYVDCKPTTMRGDAQELVGELIAAVLPPTVQAVGGLTMGADPIAHAVAGWCTRHGRPMNAFAVRKEPKKHGLRKWIEGCADAGTTVAVIDDVATTGGSTIDAVAKCREEGLRIAAVVVLVDREEGGLQAIRDRLRDVPVHAIFTRRELHEAHQAGAGPRSAAG
jgi:orotate phosphoribosyltransferase